MIHKSTQTNSNNDNEQINMGKQDSQHIETFKYNK